jgi:hypothetical protein
VKHGYVSSDAARNIYRVAVDAEGNLDLDETRALRAAAGTAQ